MAEARAPRLPWDDDANDGVFFFNYDQTDWFTPQTADVKAENDERGDGQDSMSFATMLDLANSLEGPVLVSNLSTWMPTILVATAQTYVILASDIDLSVGTLL